jgi:hypothetical protein
MSIDATVLRLLGNLRVLREASPKSLVPCADALIVALKTIEELVVEVEREPNPRRGHRHQALIHFRQRGPEHSVALA